jgi:phage terminase small subunit
MDDFILENLQVSRNDFCSRLINILTPHIHSGIKSIFDEAWRLCIENGENSKYLMTFQNFLLRVPKWNSTIIEKETQRISEQSGCGHIEELITCVHIIHLKTLTCVRAGSKQKKIDIAIPKLSEFVHKVYINVARKIYSNVYLFEKTNQHLQIQKNNFQLEGLIKECILNTIRESIPIEHLLKVYMEDQFIEEDTEVVDTEEIIAQDPVIEEQEEEQQEEEKSESRENETNKVEQIYNETGIKKQSITFDDMDRVRTMISDENISSIDELVNAPKTLERLEEISMKNFAKRKEEQDNDDDNEDENDAIQIGEPVSLGDLDIDMFSEEV